MLQSFENASKFNKEFVDTGLKNFAAVSKSAQAIAVEATDYTKKSFEAGAAALEKVLSAGSFEKALEIQADYAKHSYEGFVAEAAKVSELYADFAKQAYQPFESALAKSK